MRSLDVQHGAISRRYVHDDFPPVENVIKVAGLSIGLLHRLSKYSRTVA